MVGLERYAQCLEDVRIELTSDEGFFEPEEEFVGELAPGIEKDSESPILVKWNTEKFEAVLVPYDTAFRARIKNGDEVLWEEKRWFQVGATYSAYHIMSKPQWLAVLVHPTMPSVKELMRKVGSAAKVTTGEASFSGYGVPPVIVRNQVKAVYESVRSLQLIYNLPLESFMSGGCQAIRLPDEIVKTRQATCLDAALLFCSLFENMGLNPVLFLVTGHAFVGVHLEKRSISCADGTPREYLRLIREGKFIAIEATGCTGVRADFDEAVEKGRTNLDESEYAFQYAVDVAEARHHGIKPLVIKSKGLMETKVVRRKMKVFAVLTPTRTLKVYEKLPPPRGEVLDVVVLPDERLLTPWAKLKNEKEVLVDVMTGTDGIRRCRLAQDYLMTHVGISEGTKAEFKSSCFVSPQSGLADGEQVKTIAKTIASFMNGGGGTLFVGVDDGGYVRHGIRGDLGLLVANGTGVAVDTPLFRDVGHAFKGNADQLSIKLHNIVHGYLGSAAEAYLGDCAEHKANGGLSYVTLEIRPAPDEDIVYYPEKTSKGTIDAIYVRNGAAKKSLMGSDRDRFVRDRVTRQLRKGVEAITQASSSQTTAQVVAALQKELGRMAPVPEEVGKKVRIVGVVSISDAAIAAIKTPVELVFLNEHVRDVKGWKDCYLALLEHLQAKAPERFDDLPDQDFFCKYFLHPEAKKKYGGYYPAKFGKENSVRAKEVSGKAYFANSDYIVHRLVRYFGFAPGAVAVR